MMTIYLNCGEAINHRSCEHKFSSYENNKTNSPLEQLPVALIAQLVEHCTGIVEVVSFESRSSLNVFFFSGFNFTTVCVACTTSMMTSTIPVKALQTEVSVQIPLNSDFSSFNFTLLLMLTVYNCND